MSKHGKRCLNEPVIIHQHAGYTPKPTTPYQNLKLKSLLLSVFAPSIMSHYDPSLLVNDMALYIDKPQAQK